MEGFDFFDLAAKESREPETRELPRRILFRGKLKSGEWASGNLNVGLAVVKYDKKRSAFRAFPVDRPWYACQIAYPDEIVGNIYDDPDLLKQGEDTQK